MSPHIVVFDEPTNSMSWDALVALVAAIKTFKGGVVIISHNQAFVDEVCNDIWLMAKDPTSGIAHLTVTGGDTTDMKEIFEEKAQEDSYIDGAGNVVALKKKLNDKEAKKRITEIKKKLQANKKTPGTLTDEQMWELTDELDELTKEYLCFPLHNAISACCAPFADGLMCFLFQCMISWARTSKPSRHFLAPLSAILGWPWARTSKPSRYFLAPLSAILGWPWARTSKPSRHFFST